MDFFDLDNPFSFLSYQEDRLQDIEIDEAKRLLEEGLIEYEELPIFIQEELEMEE